MIETERLVLRRCTEDDLGTIARWNADPEFTRNLAAVQTRESAYERWEPHWQEHAFGALVIDRE